LGWPVVGETIDFVIDGRRYFRSRRSKYGKIFKTHLLGRPTVVVIGPEYVRHVLHAEDDITLTQTAPGSFPRLFGQSLCNAHGPSHRTLQRHVLRTFNHDNLARFAVAVQRVVRSAIASWLDPNSPTSSSSSSSSGSGDVVVMCVPACHQMSLDIACHVLLGLDLDSAETSTVVKLFNEFTRAAFTVPLNLPGFAFHSGLKARRQLIEIITKHSSEQSDSNRSILSQMWRDATVSTSPSTTRPLDCGGDGETATSTSSSGSSSSRLVPPPPPDAADDQSLSAVDVTLELMYGSFETTTSVMCAALVNLAEHPEVVDRLRREFEAAGINYCADDVTCRSQQLDDVSYDVLRTLTYTSDVVKELLRHQPPVAGAFRRTIGTLKIGEYEIPAGWGVLYGITDTHETASTFVNHLDFDPSRWQPFHETSRPERYSYIPFGGGSKRSCVGKAFAKLVLTVFVVELVRAVDRWRLVNGRPRIRTAPIPLPCDDLPVVFGCSSSQSNGQ
jgi:cytochrome P450 family 26 subfamily A